MNRRQKKKKKELRIVPYRECFDGEALKIHPRMLPEMKMHAGVLPESMLAVLDGRIFLGFGYLVPDGPLPETEDPGDAQDPVCVRLMMQARPGDPREAEASILLMQALLKCFHGVCRRYPGMTQVLRTWCGTDKTAYRAFLEAFGFQRAGTLLEFRRDTQIHEDLPPEDIRISAAAFTEDEKRQYLDARTRAFGQPADAAELEYDLQDPDTRIFAAYDGTSGRLAAALTAVKTGTDTAETEHIFCTPAYQGRGIASALIRHACAVLSSEGVREVSLRVYSTNTRAAALYKKLGYEQQRVLTEMHYKGEAL